MGSWELVQGAIKTAYSPNMFTSMKRRVLAGRAAESVGQGPCYLADLRVKGHAKTLSYTFQSVTEKYARTVYTEHTHRECLYALRSKLLG